MKQFVILLLATVILSSSSQGPGKLIPVKQKIEGGSIEGYVNEGVVIFKGIPFAAPPLGELRWKAPQPVIPWKGVKECKSNPPSAMQAKPVPFMMWSKEFMAPEEPLSEDCLYLNIWTTAESYKSNFPVIVWIHGGGFTGGSGTVPLYDGTEMAKKGVVFVTINYRLGIFGFLAHPDLTAENGGRGSGNYGILDQVEALKWVQKNISAFGGDPTRVTIAGQSAGSFSVNALMVSPLAKGLFSRAIGQSGGMFSTSRGVASDLKSAEANGVKLLQKIGVSSINELRMKPVDEVMKLNGMLGITIDDNVIPPSLKTFEAGRQNDVPLITGWNADDGVSMGPAMNAQSFRQNAEKSYGDRAADFLKVFPSGTDEEAKLSQKIISQMFFGYQNFKWASEQSSNGKNKAWLYYFKRVPPGEPNYGAFHSAEFGYALSTLKLWNRPFTKTDYDLSAVMSSYWVNFAKTGDPNGPGLPEWPSFSNSKPVVMELGDEAKSGPVPYIDQLKFLDSLNK